MAEQGQGEQVTRTEQGEREPAATPATAERRAGRQAPQYGEFAPEGWSWSPETATASDPTSPAPASAGSAASTPGSGQVPGVPHNLGAGGSRDSASPATGPTPPSGSSSEPASRRSYPPQVSSAQEGRRTPGGPRRGDRVVTIILLAIGALGALYLAASMQQLPTSLGMLASALGAEGFAVPASVSTLGTVGALTVLALYALSLVYSIQRMRHGRLAFWVPLAAAAIAFIVVFALSAFALNQTPELVTLLADPNASTKLLDYIAGMGADATP